MGEDKVIKYQAKAARVHWRTLFIKCQTKPRAHRAEEGWLIDACKELFDVARIKVLPGGALQGLEWEKDTDKPSDVVELEITRGALLGIKRAVIWSILGDFTTNPPTLPASTLQRGDLLEAVSAIGPDGTLRRMIESEAKLPELDGIEAKELGDLAPKEEAKK